MLRFRSRLSIAVVITGLVAACSFGVDLDHLVDGPDDGGSSETSLSDQNVGPNDLDANKPSDAGLDQNVVASVDLDQIASGTSFSCVRKSTGKVNCWGRGTEGRLGDGLAISRSTPAEVIDLNDAIDLSLGTDHACVIRKGGAVYCWGSNFWKQLGNGNNPESRIPQPVIGVSRSAVAVSGGGTHTCALLDDKTVECWGDNAKGQLGAGDINVHATPTAVKDLTDVKQIATANTSTCALTTTGKVFCWGDNVEGQGGVGDAAGPLAAPVEVQVGAAVDSLAKSSGGTHVCAVLTSGGVKCWGYNDTGALGTGIPGDGISPKDVVALSDATAVGTGSGYTCALHKDGTVSCWGVNTSRQLSIGEGSTPTSADKPLNSQGLKDITQLATGSTHACALKGKREIWCWGSDVHGALGRQRALQVPTPTKVATATEFKAIVNGRSHACGLDAAKNVWCWGDNSYRQLARTDVGVTGVPGIAVGATDVTKLAVGDNHNCAVIGDAGVRCWGEGQNGTLGSGNSPFGQTTPIPFIAPQGASDVGAGQQLSCALLKTGNVACAGVQTDGRLGSPGNTTSTPRLALAPSDGGAPASFEGVNAVAIGRIHGCAIYDGNKSLACWGNNDSLQLGRIGGSTSTPFTVTTLPKTPVQVAAGFRHTCVRVSGNATYCWGRNANGQITGTDTANTATPRAITFAGTLLAVDLALGDDHSCALLSDKTVACWGSNALGQLGTGNFQDAMQPVAVPNLKDVTAIAAEESHTCAITATGTFCWGTDFSGQLGVAPLMITGVPMGVPGL